MTHELKIWPQYYCRVADGSKTFEVRKNDRGFQPGDTVILKEWDPEYTDNSLNAGILSSYGIPKRFGRFTESPLLYRTIGYVLPLDAERVVFSLLPYDGKKKGE